jgi:uncharacterized UBP type Zn finger protein
MRLRLSDEEKSRIDDLHAVLGNHWEAIAQALGGDRDFNMVRNYWLREAGKREKRPSDAAVAEESQRDLALRRRVHMPEVLAPQSSSMYGGYRSHGLPGGLVNLGNTCYLNAVIQALCSLREFITDLRKMPEVIPQVARLTIFTKSVEIFDKMGAVGAAEGPLNPADLREMIAQASPKFAGKQQQDAHEFMLDYINQLHDDLLLARQEWLEAQSLADSEELGMLATQSHLDAEVQKTLVCCGCHERRDVPERFRDFSLDFPAAAQKSGVHGVGNSERCELRSMLKNYFKDELLKVKCPFEGCASEAVNMQAHLSSAPRVLVLHLKRYVPNMEREMYEKHHQHVKIPLSFDLREYLRNADTDSSSNEACRSFERPRCPLGRFAPNAVGEVCCSSRGGYTGLWPLCLLCTGRHRCLEAL